MRYRPLSWPACAFLGIRLDRQLPNMVLKSKLTRRHAPADLRRSQVLRLEGDFNKSFRLYVPQNYERDALYVFAPDLMAVLVDEAASVEVEVVDDWIFFYSPAPADLADPVAMMRFMRILDVVGSKAVRQPERYSDDRTGTFAENSVSQPARRLRSGVAIGGIAAAAFGVAQIVRIVVELVQGG